MTENNINAPVSGQVVQARDIQGGVHLHQSTQFIVPTAVDVPRAFGSGVEVTVGEHTYLVHAHLAEERFSADGTVSRRQARCTRIEPAGGPVWFRQDEARAGTVSQALADEHELLKRLQGKGFPQVVQFARDGGTTTLVTTWPQSGSGKPCEGLDALLGPHPLDSLRLYRLCTGLAGMCATLGALHDAGAVHHGLTPAGLIMRDDGGLVLRDLAHTTEYLAPEQHPRGPGRPGPHTDTYQLVAVAYHVITGRPPNLGTPLPVRSVPARLAIALDAALAPDPVRRPDIRALGAALRAACDDIS